MGAMHSVLAWWPGDDANYVVLSLSVKTWGRIGKLMQYTGGLVALIDIFGEDRFKKAASKIKSGALRTQKVDLIETPLVMLVGITGVIGGCSLLIAVSEVFFDLGDTVLNRLVFVLFWLVLLLLLTVLLFLPQLAGKLLMELARASSSQWNLKVTGFVIVTIGFVLDFLAS